MCIGAAMLEPSPVRLGLGLLQRRPQMPRACSGSHRRPAVARLAPALASAQGPSPGRPCQCAAACGAATAAAEPPGESPANCSEKANHGHGPHGHHHHDHDHHHHHYEESAVSRLLESVGLIQLGERMENSGACAVLSVACFAVALLLHLQFSLSSGIAKLLHDAALAGTFILSGVPQTVEALAIAGSGKLDTHVLMSLAVFGTLYLGMAHEGALLLLLFQISHTLEEKFTARARGNMERLFATIPAQATWVESDRWGAPILGSAKQVLARSIQPGDHVLVKPGEQVPLDGSVTWGTASLSLQHISGESQPVRMSVGSEVPAGSLNTDGLLVVRVTATSDDSTPARIARMAAAAQEARPRLQRLLDRVGELWSKGVIAATLATLVVLPLLGVPLLEPRGAFYRAMGVLTAGSPCAVVLVPLAYVCAIATITRKGVLVKSGAALDSIGSCTTVALDKTGTITTGSLTLTDVLVLTQPPSQQQQQQPGGALAASPSAPQGLAIRRLDLPQGMVRASSALQLNGGRGTGDGVGPLGDSQPQPYSALDLGAASSLGAWSDSDSESWLDGNSASGAGASSGAAGAGPAAAAREAAVAAAAAVPAPPSSGWPEMEMEEQQPWDELSSGYASPPAWGHGAGAPGAAAGSPASVATSWGRAAAAGKRPSTPGSASVASASASTPSLGSSISSDSVLSSAAASTSAMGRATPTVSCGGLHELIEGEEGGEEASRNGSRTGSSSSGGEGWQDFGAAALQFAVALSHVSTHPVARAMSEAGVAGGLGADNVNVSNFEQVPGSGVQGVCRLGPSGEPVTVCFGSLEFVATALPGPDAERLRTAVAGLQARQQLAGSKAMSFLSVGPPPPGWHPDSMSSSSLGSLDADSSEAGPGPELWARRAGASRAGGESQPFPGPSPAPAPICGAAPGAGAEAGPGSEAAGRAPLRLPRQRHHVALFCYEDVIQPGVAAAVSSLQRGAWRTVVNGEGVAREEHRKEVVMLTGDNTQVARQVARSVGIPRFLAELKPEHKLGFVQSFDAAQRSSSATSSAGAAWGGGGGGALPGGLLMMGDGINDAPALAAARVGVAVAATPSDMVAAAADIIILNGRGVANLPWLFKIASKTQEVVQQNLTLALVAVVCATLPTVLGFFPLWLAVLLHEGSTLLVALNSLRLLLDPQTPGPRAALVSIVEAMQEMFKPEPPAEAGGHHHHGHSHGHHHDHDHDHDHHHDHDHDHGHDHHHGHGHAARGAATSSNGEGAGPQLVVAKAKAE